jgi:hypothetical protein
VPGQRGRAQLGRTTCDLPERGASHLASVPEIRGWANHGGPAHVSPCWLPYSPRIERASWERWVFLRGALCALGRVHDAQGAQSPSPFPISPDHISPCCVRWQDGGIVELLDNGGLHVLFRARAAARHKGRAGGLISASSAPDLTTRNRLRQSRAAESGGHGAVMCSTA